MELRKGERDANRALSGKIKRLYKFADRERENE